MRLESFQRVVLLFTGITLVFIGIAYCIDPNLLLSRYELSVAEASDDNMYRGAYGGLFITIGAAVACGFTWPSFRRSSTVIALLFMSGFAIGRIASIFAVGTPHQQILGLLGFELVSSLVFLWFLMALPNTNLAE